MLRAFALNLCLVLVATGLLVPKASALLAHLSPHITAVVICTGTELVTIHLGADGQPVEVTEADHAPCVLANPDTTTGPDLTRWTAAPRVYSLRFPDTPVLTRARAERGLLPDLRGPPARI